MNKGIEGFEISEYINEDKTEISPNSRRQKDEQEYKEMEEDTKKESNAVRKCIMVSATK